jgi:guanine nucleotide-binding protein subunit alpha
LTFGKAEANPPGAADSGKSTIIKQMRIIHHGGFTEEERRTWRRIIFRNLVDAFLYLINIMHDQNIELQAQRNEVRPSAQSPPADSQERYRPLLESRRDIGRNEGMPYEYFDCFVELWADASLQLAILKNRECVLSDNLS